MPVAVSRIETMAPGITAPDASLMVPESVAPATWAQAPAGSRIVIAKMTKTEDVVVILFKGTMSSMDVPSRRSKDPNVFTHGTDLSAGIVQQRSEMHSLIVFNNAFQFISPTLILDNVFN